MHNEANPSATNERPEKMPGIGHLVAVASAKGGVGKSTVTVNLALALSRAGLRVGIVDADILGPSIPVMLGAGAEATPEEQDGRLVPFEAQGIKFVSMGVLTDDDNPAILRGPMVTKYMQFFLAEVAWGELDYLLIDLPPGTGDTQLTLAQRAPLSGVVIVTTPQDVSLRIARRGLRMFERVRVPVLGIVENMSGFSCPHCGETTDIFRRGGGERLGREVGTPSIGRIPMDTDVVLGGDQGEPVVCSKPDSAAAKAYNMLADTLVGVVQRQEDATLPAFRWEWGQDESLPPWNEGGINAEDGKQDIPLGVRNVDARTLEILWQDGSRHSLNVRDVRLACQCAYCVEEMTGKPLLDPSKIPLDVAPVSIRTVGRYAIAFVWTDGHDAGIYTFDRLRALCDSSATQDGMDV